MKVYLTKCKDCKKYFHAKRGGFLRRLVTRGGEENVPVDIPFYGMAGVKCPRCGSTNTKTLNILNIET